MGARPARVEKPRAPWNPAQTGGRMTTASIAGLRHRSHRWPDRWRHVARVVAASVAVALVAVGSASGQKVPERPGLPADADTNDAQSYYRYGADPHVDWKKSYDAFYWAWRLEPNEPQYLFAMYLALFNRQSPQWQSEWMAGAGYVTKSKEAKRIDSLFGELLLRNPYPQFSDACYLDESLDRQRDRILAATIHYVNGCYGRASKAFGEVLDKKPEVIGAHVYRARSFYFLQRPTDAARELRIIVDSLRARDEAQLVRWYDSKAMFEYMIGIAWVQAGDLTQARDAFGRALMEDMSFHMAHVWLARVAQKQRDLEVARTELALAADLVPDDPVVRHEYGEVLLRVNAAAEAAVQFQEAVRLEPYWADSYFHLGIALQRTERHEEALAAFDAFLARCPQRLHKQAETARAHMQKSSSALGATGTR